MSTNNQEPERPSFDVVAAVAEIKRLQTEINSLKRKVRDFRKGGDYGLYLKSSWWQGLRKKHCGCDARCAGCGSAELLELHHTSYERLYGESTGDLVVLCKWCHLKLHDYLNNHYPRLAKSTKAGNTKKVFQDVFKKRWLDEYEVKLPGRRVGRSVAQRVAQKAVAKRHKARKKVLKEFRQSKSDSPPEQPWDF